ncbi:hypothetical protein DXG01_011035 [Tephrocybe rancida]|nr:hypothetical protein DXG01_011035 [Tephrocybe rancida]
MQKIKELEANTKKMENLDMYIVELKADKAQMQIDLTNFKASAEQSKQESQMALEKYRQDNKNLGEENQRGQAELDACIKGLEVDKSQMQIDLSNFKALTEQSKQESQTALEQY